MVKQATSIQNDLPEVVAQELEITKNELAVTYQELRTTKDELAATKKELKATKKKLQTLNHAAQNQVAQSEQLHRLKEDFLSTINHELRSPLSNMKMAIHLLNNDPKESERERYLESLQANCAREIELITNLLDLQRLETGHYCEVLVEVVNLHEWLPSILEPFHYRTQHLRQTLQVNLPPEIPSLLIDRVSLRRILTELLTNACKYTPAGGEIVFSARYDKEVFTEKPDSKTHCSYLPGEVELPAISGSDSSSFTAKTTFIIRNSAEIHLTQLSRIFEKFYRGSQVDLWQQGGMGLGLALVQKLVEHLRGTIQVESSEGWTTFTVCFATPPTNNLHQPNRIN